MSGGKLPERSARCETWATRWENWFTWCEFHRFIKMQRVGNYGGGRISNSKINKLGFIECARLIHAQITAPLFIIYTVGNYLSC
jgi:hypothetical protein